MNKKLFLLTLPLTSVLLLSSCGIEVDDLSNPKSNPVTSSSETNSSEISSEPSSSSSSSSSSTSYSSSSQNVTYYEVKFYLGDYLAQTNNVLKGAKMSSPISTLVAGYTVNYWYYLNSNNQEVIWNFASDRVNSTLNLYADFTANQYTISCVDETFNTPGYDVNVTYKQSYALSSNTYTGYNFTGWKDANNVVWPNSGTYNVVGNTTLYAMWSPKLNTLTVTSADTSKGTVSVQSGQGYSDEHIIVAASPKTGYVFEGWYSNDILVSYSEPYDFTMPRNNYALEARFVEIPEEPDDGTDYTYGKAQYNNVNWSSYSIKASSSSDLKTVGAGYQIFVPSFSDSDGDGLGDIYGVTQKLNYIQSLGVKAIDLSCVLDVESPVSDLVVDFDRINPSLGSSVSPNAVAASTVNAETAAQDFVDLITAAHDMGIKVIMDININLTSVSNTWFVASANHDADYRGYYQWGNHDTDPSHISQNKNWYPYDDTVYSYYAKYGAAYPELNYSYTPTRIAIRDVLVHYIKDFGLDGYKLENLPGLFFTNEVASTSGDTIVRDVSSVGDFSYDLTKTNHFLRELRAQINENSGKNVILLGENFNGHAYHVSPMYESLDSLFDFYSYYNFTSSAATGRTNSSNAYGVINAYMANSSNYSTSVDTDSYTGIVDSHGDFVTANGHEWNYVGIYSTYNAYRGDTTMPMFFMGGKNVDRSINRIGGTGNVTGIIYPGNVTTSNWATLEKSSNLMKIGELMMPGTTWIYYGDELGMTSNNENIYQNSEYTNITYLQPMKWVTTGGTVGDGNGTTGYYVGPSHVTLDSVNSSSVVKGALDPDNQELNSIKPFITLKNRNDSVGDALRRGTISQVYYANGSEQVANVLQFRRQYNSTTIKVAVNFNSYTSFSLTGMGGTVLASYGGATTTNLPAYSAIVVME